MRWLLCCALAAGCQCRPPEVPLPDGGVDAGELRDSGAPDSGAGDSGVADSGAVDAGAPDAGASLCDALLAATCAWSERCGRLDAPQRDDCVSLGRWTCSQAQVDAVVDAGKVTFAAGKVASCLAALEATSCDNVQPYSPECELFAPATPLGGTCTQQWSTVCSGSYCRGAGCPGTCTAYLALDAGCTGLPGDECGPGAYCDAQSRVCAAVLGEGASCVPNQRCERGTCDSVQQRCVAFTSLDAGAGCGSDSVCGGGLYCRLQACAPREQAGGPCRLYGGLDCDDPFTCRLFDGGTSGTCAPRSGDGGACFGLPADCVTGFLCDSPMLFAAGSCVPFRSEGEGCSRALDNCKVGLVCDAATLRCRRLPRVGEPCSRDMGNFRSSDCADGFCPADGGVCLAPQQSGAACERPWECASGACEAGGCAALCTSF